MIATWTWMLFSAVANDATTVDQLQAVQSVFRDVARRVRPAMVRIETVGGTQPRPPGLLDPDMDEDEEGPGQPPAPSPFTDDPGSSFVVADGPTTGLIYSPDGYIVTSSFNFAREPLLISVTLADGRRLAARLVARDKVRKIALLKVEADNLPVPTWCDPSELHTGQWAIALGLGFGGQKPSVHVGIVSAFNRMLGNAIQTDAKLSPANYGGPVCDIHGRVIGLSVPMAQRPGELAGIEFYDSGIGFVLPRQRLGRIVDVLKTGRSYLRGWLGMQADPNAIRTSGAVIIANLAKRSPLHDLGVMPGDTLVRLNDRRIRHFQDLRRAIYMLPAGETVEVEVERDGVRIRGKVRLAAAEELGELLEWEQAHEDDHALPDDE